MLSAERQHTVAKLCQELIKSQSYSGQEEQVVGKLKEAFNKMGFDEVKIDSYGNITGCIKGNQPGKNILFDGHIDTVPVADASKWSHDPFGAEIKNGNIYGRGASDMKGSVAAMLCAAAFFAQDSNRDFAGNLYVAGVVHEEMFEGIAARKISEEFKPDFIVIGEASELNLKRGQRGRAEIVVETFGITAHSANPQNGVNAVYKMVRLIEAIKQLETPHHKVLGKGILELTDIKSSPYPGASVVPDYCRVTYDRRLLVGETKESVLNPILELIAKMKQQDVEFNARASFAIGKESCYTGETIEGERFFPAWLNDENDDFVQKAYLGLQAVGLNPMITEYSFCTNGSHYAGEKGIKTIGFGPSRENQAHTINEYIELDQLFNAARGYYGIIQSVLG